uniref:Perlucin 2 n=1 Tax=Haliotis diversicolor TaxID=36095 RepID=G5CT92_HALDV|nr:perlucin 2 [Haliotis diversicolor]
MKLLIVAVVAVTSVMADSHHHYPDTSKFHDYLKDIQESKEFQYMPIEAQVLYGKLITAAEQGSAALTAIIKAEGFDNILRLIDYLDEDDIPHFEGYLAAHLNGGIVLGKRQSGSDLFNFMKDLQLVHKIDDDLSHADMQLFLQLLYAAEHNNLTLFIENTGYGPILDLMAQVDDDEHQAFDELIITHLAYEATQATTVSAV